MNQNVHAVNTTILEYAKQEDGMNGKAFENKTILKQMEQKTKKKKLESWLIVCSEKHGKQMRWRHASLFHYKHFLFFCLPPRVSITWFKGACLSSRMSEFNLRHVWKTHVLHASSWIAGRVSEFDFHKPPPRIPNVSGVCFLNAFIASSSLTTAAWGQASRSLLSNCASFLKFWSECFVLLCFAGALELVQSRGEQDVSLA